MELQSGLIGLGVAAVVGVVAYNKWQEYRHRKLDEQFSKTEHNDVLLGGSEKTKRTERTERAEPRVDHQAGAELNNALSNELSNERANPNSANAAAEPQLFGELSTKSDTNPDTEPSRVHNTEHHAEHLATQPLSTVYPAIQSATDPLHLLSPSLDYIVSFESHQAIALASIFAAQKQAASALHKPLLWIGYHEAFKQWEVIDAAQSAELSRSYDLICVGLQLADRRGSLSASDLSCFHSLMQDFAAELGVSANFPIQQSALDSAADLDRFCAEVDIQLGVNVLCAPASSASPTPTSGFLGEKLMTLSAAAHMHLDAVGRFVYPDAAGKVLFAMHNIDGLPFTSESLPTAHVQGLTFLFELPRVANGVAVFNQMLELAQHFADQLQGQLVDDNQQPLSEKSLEPIRQQIIDYQALMQTRGLPAGEFLAQRLFS